MDMVEQDNFKTAPMKPVHPLPHEEPVLYVVRNTS